MDRLRHPRTIRSEHIRFCKINPDREIVLWVDCECSSIEGVKIRTVDRDRLINREIYERTNNIGVKADLILEHGGIYSDVDAVALRRFSNIFDSPFLAYEPHKWRDIGNSVFGFPKNDLFLNGCVYNLKEHIRWVVSERPDLLSPTGDNVGCLCGGFYIMSQLFRWRSLDELAFISQDYLVTDTGFGFSMHTMDGTWIESLQSVSSLL